MMERLPYTNTPPFYNNAESAGICFKTYMIRSEEKLSDLNLKANHLVFLVKGELSAQYNEFQPIKVNGGELFLIPISAQYALTAFAETQLVVCAFESLHLVPNKLHTNIRIYTAMIPMLRFAFTSLPIHDMLEQYLLLYIEYMKSGIDSESICVLKFQELFTLLTNLYRKDDMAGLLYPILGQSPDFKSHVMEHFPHINNVDELAGKMGMGRGSFDLKFKKEFGMTPLQWILKEKAKHVYFSLSEPENTLNDVMNKYNFNSFTHLNRFCKQQFGCSPSELRKRLTRND
ncbi:MAG: helix-turn-helix transcriptional regulator [Tannerellaceae bacterium]|nr:helix-turn-helix transcriptional regulator [Tannerellaceae bacterium]